MTEGEGTHHAAKDPCDWRPGVNPVWTKANKESFSVPLQVDCDGTYTAKWPDDLESISYRALVKEGTAAPTGAQVRDMEHQIIALNDHDEGQHHGYRSLDCNPDFIGKNWKLLVPGVTPDCQPPVQPPPAPVETAPPPPKVEKPPCHSCEWDDSLEPGPQNPPQGDRHPQGRQQPFDEGEIVIYNEKGGVINFNDDDCDCGPSTMQGRQRAPQRRESYIAPDPSPTYDERCPEGGCGPDPRWLPRQNPLGTNGYYTGRGGVPVSYQNDYVPGDFE